MQTQTGHFNWGIVTQEMYSPLALVLLDDEKELLRRAIITEKVKLLLTLYRPLPSPLFYLVKPKLLALPPLPPKVSKN